jgi:hypothetical protein
MLQDIKRIIDSCETYEQVQTCLSFVDWPRPGIGPAEKAKILGWLQTKTYELRNQDLEFHKQEMAKLRQARAEILARD